MVLTGITTARQRIMVSVVLLFLMAIMGCGDSTGTDTTKANEAPDKLVAKPLESPDFSADSAYVYIEKQLSFGPRVPNTGAHVQCAKWLEQQFNAFGAKVTMQPARVTAYNGDQLSMVNIIAAYRPELTRRVLLSAHWDSRPFSDMDPDPEKRKLPVPAANDGASGVAVLLEIARQLQQLPPDIGVDLILWDAEDYGSPGAVDSYGLGSQYWSKQPHVQGYRAIFGINLDMVGALHAQFPKEGYSMQYAPDVVQRVWDAARQLGHGGFFVSRRNEPIVDDHYYLNRDAQIPTIDIIDIRSGTGFFGAWHTHADDLTQIDKATLQAVGETVLAVVYQMK